MWKREYDFFLVKISSFEIFKEKVFDLLNPKTTGPARAPIKIKEKVTRWIIVAGVTEATMRTKEEMASYLLHGSLTRATGSTNMNSQSSYSHVIFSISMEQRKNNPFLDLSMYCYLLLYLVKLIIISPTKLPAV